MRSHTRRALTTHNVERIRILRKSPISFVMLVRPCVCPHVSARLPLDGFSWISILGTFIKICRQNTGSLKYDKNIGHFTRRHKYVYIVESNIKSLNNTKVHALSSCHDNAFGMHIVKGDKRRSRRQDKHFWVSIATLLNLTIGRTHCSQQQCAKFILNCQRHRAP